MIINTVYDLDNNGNMWAGNKLWLRWREQEGEKWVRKEKLVTDFEPYAFIKKNGNHFVTAKDGFSRKVPSHLLDKQDGLWMIDRTEATNKVSAENDQLTKVVFKSSSAQRSFQYTVKSDTYEVDVPYEDRYLIDNVDKIPEYKMRKLFIDLEALQFNKGDDGPLYCKNPSNPKDFQEINVIGAYDSFTKQRIQWCQHPNYNDKSELLEFDGDKVMVNYFSSEKKLLLSFVEFVEKIDPDCILAWGMGFYDLPTLYYRLESTGIGADRLSPKNMVSKSVLPYVMPPKYKGNQYRWTAQPIIGRLVISLDRLFERIYKDSKSANLPSNKLDVVGQKLFGRGKTEFRPDFYNRDYDEFMHDYLYYNYRDVELMVEIEEKYNLIEGQQALQQLSKCQFNSTFYGSSFARVYFMRKANFIQKTGWQETFDEELKGAIVLDPEELNSIGAHHNVVILDFAGLYPSMMIAYNTSFETKVKKGEERDDDIIGDGCRFRREPIGLLPSCVIELDELRDHYKKLRSEAAKTNGKASDEYRKWDDAQKTVKRLRATFYGLMGFGRHGYAWGDIDIARTITHGGRTALTRIQKACEELGYEVIYGHTDSIFVKLGDDKSIEECAELAQDLGNYLTIICQEDLKSEAVEVEAELIMDRFYLPRRNKYAGRIVWQPGTGETPFDIGQEPVDKRIKLQGLEAKHTNTAPIGKEVQLECLKMIWDGETALSVLNYVQSYIETIRNGEVPVDELIGRARLGKWLPTRNTLKSIEKAAVIEELDHDGVPTGNKIEVSASPLHYGWGATNNKTSADAKDESDQCYSVLTGDKRGAAWHNIVLSNEMFPKLDKGDSYYYTYAIGGPTWIPEGGYISFHELSQVTDYELNIELIIEKNIINKLDHIMYGMGLSNDLLRLPKDKFDGVRLSIEDFQK